MRKTVSAVLLVAAFAVLAHAQQTSVRKTSVQSFKIGDTPVLIPAPTAEMVELGDQRSRLPVIVPPGGRLVAAFAVPGEISAVPLSLSQYALVEVVLQTERQDVSPQDFKAVISAGDFADVVDGAVPKIEEIMKDRNIPLNLGKPVKLGRFFSKEDAVCNGAIFPVSGRGKTVAMAAGASLIRVKKRILFAHVYAVYKDADTVAWLRRTAEEWINGILRANQ